MTNKTDDIINYSDIIRQIYSNFYKGHFEYFHVRNKIPGYNHGLHMRLAHCGAISRIEHRGKVKIWKISDVALTKFGLGATPIMPIERTKVLIYDDEYND